MNGEDGVDHVQLEGKGNQDFNPKKFEREVKKEILAI
jgi:hypothetical protein